MASLGGYFHGSTLYPCEHNPLISLQIPLHYLTLVEPLKVKRLESCKLTYLRVNNYNLLMGGFIQS